MPTTPPDASPFVQRWLYFSLFAGTALLAATVVTQGLPAASPSVAAGGNGLGFAMVVHALAGATLGALAAYRLRAGGTDDESVNVDALALGAALAIGAAAAAWLTPLGTTMKARGALAIWPVAAAGVVGAAIAAARGGRAVPVSRADLASAPLGAGERAAVEQARAQLDTLERFHDRVAEPSASRPDEADTEQFFDAHEQFRQRCARLSSLHAATHALQEAGDALVTAVELRYVARGWHEDLGVEPGDPEGIASARRAWHLDATEPAPLATALAARASAARDRVDGFVAGARSGV